MSASATAFTVLAFLGFEHLLRVAGVDRAGAG
jgi:hypothetical protein